MRNLRWGKKIQANRHDDGNIAPESSCDHVHGEAQQEIAFNFKLHRASH